MSAKHGFPVVTMALACVACAPSDTARDDGPIGHTRQAILNGTESDESQDDTVLLFHLDPSGPRRLGICTATLIAPRLVLTARHCVATTDAEVACNSDGTPLLGAKIVANHVPSDLYVFTGKDRPALIGAEPPALDPTKWKPAGQGLEIIDDRSGTLCNHDLAIVLLKEPIANVPIAALRLDGDVSAGEKLLTVGWGVTSGEIEPSRRQQRSGVSVKRVGPSDSIPILTKSEFLFDESICLGDSGGPVFAQKTNAVVGVVSRGGNGLDATKGGPSSTCVEADNVSTKVAPFKELVTEAFQRVGGQPRLEEKPEETCSVGPVGLPIHGRGTSLVGLAIAAVAWIRRRRAV